METTRKRIRKDFSPLTVSTCVKCITEASSPLIQIYDSLSDEFVPDRAVSPCGLLPIINAQAADGSWDYPNANALLANIKWLVNGVDISTIQSWTGKYTIDTSATSDKGALTISRNIQPGERLALRFKADLVDTRLGVTFHIETEDVVLSAIDKSTDNHKIDLGEAQNITYNPFNDRLLEYEYKVAHGIIAPSPSARAACIDSNCYLRTIPITAYKGSTKLPTTDYTVKLFKMNSVSSFSELTTDDDEVLEISTSQIQLDMRLIEKGNYMVRAYVAGEEIGSQQFTVARAYQNFTCQPTNETPILPSQDVRFDEVQVDSKGRKIAYPENILTIVWYTDSAHATNVQHNEGQNTVFRLDKTGIGDTYLDDWLDVYVNAQQKPAYKVATDGNGDIYTDENNETLIIN